MKRLISNRFPPKFGDRGWTNWDGFATVTDLDRYFKDNSIPVWDIVIYTYSLEVYVPDVFMPQVEQFLTSFLPIALVFQVKEMPLLDIMRNTKKMRFGNFSVSK